MPSSPPRSPSIARDVELAEAEPAAAELVSMLCHVYTDRNGRIHAPTIVGGGPALTGEFALRATGLPLPRIGFVFGDPINESLFEGGRDRATLWDVMEKSAAAVGMPREELPDAREVFGRVAAAATTITPNGGGAVGIAFQLAVEVIFSTAKMAPLAERV